MSRVVQIVQALYLGSKLRHSATWKDAGALVALVAPLVAILGKWAAAAGWLPGELSQAEIDAIAQWVWSGSGIVLAYWFRATSEDVGWGHRQEIEGALLPEPDEQVGPESVGVLHRMPELYLRDNASSHRHPGDDPGLDSFNR
jgi:hypothetical protein